jgi:hypothetical protein
MEVLLKTIVAALGCASLLATALPAAAQSSHHSGGWGHSSAGSPSGVGVGSSHSGFPGGSFGGRSGFAGGFHHGFGPRHVHFGYPFYAADFGLGFALGLSVIDPWYWDSPYYYGGYYAPYPPPGGYYPPPPGAYPPPPPGQAAPPPPGAAAPPAAACGSWSWDAAKQAYNWVPCAA